MGAVNRAGWPTLMPHSRTWSAFFLASGQSRAVPSALEMPLL